MSTNHREPHKFVYHSGRSLFHFIKNPLKHSVPIRILVLLLIVAAIPLTVYIAQQQQEIRQRASAIEYVMRLLYTKDGSYAEIRCPLNQNAGLGANLDPPQCQQVRSLNINGIQYTSEWIGNYGGTNYLMRLIYNTDGRYRELRCPLNQYANLGSNLEPDQCQTLRDFNIGTNLQYTSEWIGNYLGTDYLMRLILEKDGTYKELRCSLNQNAGLGANIEPSQCTTLRQTNGDELRLANLQYTSEWIGNYQGTNYLMRLILNKDGYYSEYRCSLNQNAGLGALIDPPQCTILRQTNGDELRLTNLQYTSEWIGRYEQPVVVPPAGTASCNQQNVVALNWTAGQYPDKTVANYAIRINKDPADFDPDNGSGDRLLEVNGTTTSVSLTPGSYVDWSIQPRFTDGTTSEAYHVGPFTCNGTWGSVSCGNQNLASFNWPAVNIPGKTVHNYTLRINKEPAEWNPDGSSGDVVIDIGESGTSFSVELTPGTYLDWTVQAGFSDNTTGEAIHGSGSPFVCSANLSTTPPAATATPTTVPSATPTPTPTPTTPPSPTATTSPAASPTVTGPQPSATPTPTGSRPSPTATGTQPSATPLPTDSVFALTIGLQGIGDAGNNTNPRNPEKDVTVSVFNAAGAKAAERTGKIRYNQDTGLFSGDVNTGTIANANYTVKVKVKGYLVKQVPGIYTVRSGGNRYSIQNIRLTTGDANNDNRIDIADWNIVSRDCYTGRATSTCDTTRLSPDTNDDGKVDGADTSTIIRNLPGS